MAFACAAAAKDEYHRNQGLRFLHVTLASMLNLRSPEDSTLRGRSLDKLAARWVRVFGRKP